ncbi:MAG: sigma-70 family RNA polymerase sigma factor [Eubacterium sp.]
MESIYRETDSSDGKTTNIIDKIEAENKSEDIVVDKMFVEEILDSLNETERKIIVLRYFQNKTQAQIAELIGKNQVQVSRMEKKILLNLKEKFFK